MYQAYVRYIPSCRFRVPLAPGTRLGKRMGR